MLPLPTRSPGGAVRRVGDCRSAQHARRRPRALAVPAGNTVRAGQFVTEHDRPAACSSGRSNRPKLNVGPVAPVWPERETQRWGGSGGGRRCNRCGTPRSSPKHWRAASRRSIQSGRANTDPWVPEMVEATSNLVSERTTGRRARLCGPLWRSGWRSITASRREPPEMKRSDHVDRWLHGEENRANQEKPIRSPDHRREKEERAAHDKAQRGAEVDSGADDLVSPVDLEVTWGQVSESRTQELHLGTLPGDWKSNPRRPRPDGLLDRKRSADDWIVADPLVRSGPVRTIAP